MNLNQYQKLALLSAFYPGKDSIQGVIYTTLKLNGEAGEVAEKIGKILRDQDGVMGESQKTELAKELGDILWYVSACAAELGFSLLEIADQNLRKLESRKARGALSGSGDNR